MDNQSYVYYFEERRSNVPRDTTCAYGLDVSRIRKAVFREHVVSYQSVGTEKQMKYRTLGKTGIRVSEIGVGGHQIMEPKESLDPVHAASWKSDFGGKVPMMNDRDRAAIIGRALDLGVNYFDTSLDPETESLGKSLKLLSRREECVTTLVAGVMQYMVPHTVTYWAKKAVAQDIDKGLSLFGYDHFEVCITCMCNMWYGHHMIEGALEAMAEAKEAGKIQAAGISDHQDGEFLAYVMERYHEYLDMVMYPLSYVRQDAVTKLLPLAAKYDIGFVAMKPLARGEVLADPGVREYADGLGVTPAVGALRWVLEHPEVSVALDAVNALHEIEENVTASV